MIEEVVMETGKSRHNLLDMSRITAWVLSFEFSLPSSSFSVTLFIILKQITMTMSFLFVRLNRASLSLSLSLSLFSLLWKHMWEDTHLSLTKLALAKQSNPELMRTIKMPGVLMAMGYWLMSQKISVPGSLPNPSTLGLMEFSIIFANEIVTCMQSFQDIISVENNPSDRGTYIDSQFISAVLSVPNRIIPCW